MTTIWYIWCQITDCSCTYVRVRLLTNKNFPKVFVIDQNNKIVSKNKFHIREISCHDCVFIRHPCQFVKSKSKSISFTAKFLYLLLPILLIIYFDRRNHSLKYRELKKNLVGERLFLNWELDIWNWSEGKYCDETCARGRRLTNFALSQCGGLRRKPFLLRHVPSGCYDRI